MCIRDSPYRVRSVAGTYRQRVTLDPLVGEGNPRRRSKRVIIHASHLVPYNKPYVDPEDLNVGEDATPETEDQAQAQGDPGSLEPVNPGRKTSGVPRYHPKTKTKDPKTKTKDPKTHAEDTYQSDLPDHSRSATRSKRQRAAVVNVWTLLSR